MRVLCIAKMFFMIKKEGYALSTDNRQRDLLQLM